MPAELLDGIAVARAIRDEVAVDVMWPYVEGTIDREAFREMVEAAYATFELANGVIAQFNSSWAVRVRRDDLVTFQVDHERALRMAAVMPPGVVRVAESGVRGPADAAALYAAGYHAVLVGETLVTSGDPAAAIRGLITG